MSWSKSAKGTPSEVKDAAAKWAEEQAATDAGYQNQEGSKGHQAQIGRAVGAIDAITDGVADDAHVDVSAYGHHDGRSQSDSGGITISYYVPAKD